MGTDIGAVFDIARDLIKNSQNRQALQVLQDIDTGPLSAEDLGQYHYLRAVATIYLGKYDDVDIKKAMEILHPLEPGSGFTRALLMFGILRHRQGHWAEGRRIFSRARRTASRSGDKETEAIALGQLAWDFSMTRKFSLADAYFERSIDLYEEIGDSKHKRDMIYNQSCRCIEHGRIQEGLSKYLANPLSRNEISLNTASSYFLNIAVAYCMLGKPEQARDAMAKGYQYFLDNRRNQAMYKQNMGKSYMVEHDYETALSWFRESLKIAEAIGSSLVPGLQRWTGECCLELGDMGGAEKHTARALTKAREVDERLEIGACCRVLGAIAGLRGETDRATELLEESLKIFTRLDSLYELALTRYYAGHLGLFSLERQNEFIRQSTEYFDAEGVPLPTRPADFKIRLARALLDADSDLKNIFRSKRDLR